MSEAKSGEHILEQVGDLPGRGHLAVGDGHDIYYEAWGNPEGEPVVHLHGGPGQGFTESHTTLYNPREHFVVFSDQRETDRSTFDGDGYDYENNRTANLIGDINKLADHFGLESFNVSGGSWGSTLALAYSIENPDRVRDMLLWGVYTARQEDSVRFLGADQREFAQSQFVRLANALDPDLPFDGSYESLAANLLEQIQHADDNVLAWKKAAEAATAYGLYQFKLAQPVDTITIETQKEYALIDGAISQELPSLALYGLAKLKRGITTDLLRQAAVPLHYFANSCFMEDGYIHENVGRLAGKRVFIANGALDYDTPKEGAEQLHEAMQAAGVDSRLDIVAGAGHLRDDRMLNLALREATAQFGS